MKNKTYKNHALAQNGISFFTRLMIFAGSFAVMVFGVVVYHSYTVLVTSVPPQKVFVDEKGASSRLVDPCGLYQSQPRGKIWDRNGELLAISRQSYNLTIKPDNLTLQQAEKIASELQRLIPGIDRKKVMDALHRGKEKMVIKTRAMSDDLQTIKQLPDNNKIKSLVSWDDRLPLESRYYPKGELTAHVVGRVTLPVGKRQLTSHSPRFDNPDEYYYQPHELYGISGIEKGTDCSLREGKDITSTIDVRLQHILKATLARQRDQFLAKQAGGLLMDIHNGHILALVSLPDFEPNLTRYKGPPAVSNMIIDQRFEVGSVFKVVNFSIAFESKTVLFQQSFNVKRPLRTSSGFIRDFLPKKAVLTLEEVFTHSSNIGSALIARAVPIDFYQQNLRKFNLLTAPQVNGLAAGAVIPPLHNIGSSLMENQRDYISHGYGIALSPIHIATVIASLVSDGRPVYPSLVLNPSDIPSAVSQKRLISSSTSKAIRHLLYQNVLHGTGKGARISGFPIGGKTGTANKINDKGVYDNSKRRASFVAVFPIHQPQYILFVTFDEPRPKTEKGFATGGTVAAPVAREVIYRMLPLLNLKQAFDPTLTAQSLPIPKELQ